MPATPVTDQDTDTRPQPFPDGEPPGSTVRVRRDAWKLQPRGAAPHPILEAYGIAVATMKQNQTIRSRRWRYQAEVHGMEADPFDGLRSQCQHGSWYFLPWHRFYLQHFEAVCLAVIRESPDVSDEVKETWALPYWDYDRPGARAIPLAFRDPSSPLFEARRDPNINRGATLVPDVTTARGWYWATPYAGSDEAAFGGPVTDFHHDPGRSGQLEGLPHNIVHMAIGGDFGLMRDPVTAAFDPIFWLHHANIDRLWEVWRAATGDGMDPDPTQFRERFEFLGPDGARVPVDWTQVFDTRALGYQYEDIAKPASAGDTPPSGRSPLTGPQAAGATPPSDPRRGRPGRHAAAPSAETVAANAAPLRLGAGEPTAIDLEIAEHARRPVAGLGREDLGEPRMILVLDHITADATTATTYAVYAGTDDADMYVGALPLFGIERAMARDAEHGLSYEFDITDAVRVLRDRGTWDPAHLQVHFRALGLGDPEDDDVTDDAYEASLAHQPEQWAAPPDIIVGSIRLLMR